jgi:hypothetical protein
MPLLAVLPVLTLPRIEDQQVEGQVASLRRRNQVNEGQGTEEVVVAEQTFTQ